MTPDWARKLLVRNPRNRRIKPGSVQAYAEDIRKDKWQLSPAMIAVDTDGSLLDGQHRLLAIIETGETVRTLMGTGFSPECFSVVDIGSTRTMGDIITISHKDSLGGDGRYDSVTCASIVRLILHAKTHPDKVWVGSYVARSITKALMYDEFMSNPAEYERAARLAKSTKNRFRPINCSVLGALIVMAERRGSVDVVRYAELLGTGEGLPKGSPILAFRAYLLNAQQTKTTAQQALANCAKNFRQWRTGAEISIFRPSPCLPCSWDF
jgi:hypothetical protein